MSAERCLVCERTNEEGALLCAHCGAPLPEPDGASASGETPAAEPAPKPVGIGRRQARRRRTLAILVGVGLLVVASVVAVVLWTRGPVSPGIDLAQRLPSGLDVAAGLDFRQLLRHPKIKTLLDNTLVSDALETARKRYGVNFKALEAGAGGSQLVDGALHLLVVVKGEFIPARLDAVLAGWSTGDVEVDGATLHAIPASGLLGMLIQRPAFSDVAPGDGDPGPAPSASGAQRAGLADDAGDRGGASLVPVTTPPAAIPRIAPLLIGLLDDKTLVLGSRRLIERFSETQGPLPESDSVGQLLAEVDPAALGFAVGTVGDVAASAVMWGLDPAPLLKASEALTGLTYRLQCHLQDALTLSWALRFPTRASVDLGQRALQSLKDRLAPLQSLLILAGHELPAATQTVDGRVVTGSLTIPLPKLPML